MIRGYKFCIAALAVLALVTATTDVVRAQPAHARPGSALMFPVYDSRPSAGTLITVTNTNSSRVSCGNQYTKGDVCVHYVYFDSEQCLEFDKTECLTPGDTLTLLADKHNPEGTIGWLWVEARDPETGEAIDYDYLTGSAILVYADGDDQDFLWSYVPYTFRAQRPDCGPQSDCGYCYTDVAPANGSADFNGAEYDKFPDTLYLDNFFAEEGTPDVSNGLYLMIPDGIGGQTFKLDIRTWDNNETPYSKLTTIGCWFGGSLGSLTSVVKEVNLKQGAANELPYGNHFIYTGWMRFQVRESGSLDKLGLLGAFFHEINGTQNPFAAGRELQYTGTADRDVSIFRFDN